MTGSSSPSRPWLPLTAGFAVLVLLGTIAFGWDRSFWYDEVYTLGAAAVGRPPPWEIILRDIHPPTFTFLVRAWGQVVGGDTPLLRLVNLPALAFLVLGLRVASAHLSRAQTLLLTGVLLVNGYTLQLGLDLRSYALLLGLATLMQALFLSEVAGGKARTPWLILVGLLLSALHFFGLALALSVLGLSILRAGARGNWGRVAVMALGGAGMAVAVLGFAFFVASAGTQLGGVNWIKLGPEPYLEFLSQQLPLVALILGLLVYRHARPAPEPARVAARWMLFAPLIVIAVTTLLSLHTPVVTTRNLIVCVPGFAFAAILAVPPALLEKLRLTPIALIVIVAAGLRYADTATRNAQMIAWAITTAVPPECEGVPIYVIQPSTVDRFAQEVFLGEVRRPQVELTTFSADDPFPATCDILAVGWHQIGAVSDVTAFFRAKGVETEALLPPDRRLAERGQMTSGFVIRRLR